MRYSLFSSALVVALAGLGRADDCDTGPFAASQVAGPKFPGGNDPETRCNTKWQSGEVIIGIEAWSARFQMKAVRFKYSQSGWGDILGSRPDSPEQHQQSEWEIADEVAISMWNNKPDSGTMDAVGRIKITKGGNTIFDVGANAKKTAGDEIIVDAAAGMILAARTRTGAWFQSLEFKMLKSKVVGTELIDLKVTENIDDWNAKKTGIQDNINLSYAYFVNSNPVGGNNLTYTFTTTDSKNNEKSITSQRTNQWAAGLKVTVGGEVGIPLLTKGKVDVETSFQYTRVNMDGQGTSESQAQSLAVTLGTPGASSLLQPQTAVLCQSWVVRGNFESAYTGTIKATLADGSTYTYNDVGDVTSVGWTKGAASCGEIAMKDVPDGVQIGQTIENPSKRAVSFKA